MFTVKKRREKVGISKLTGTRATGKRARARWTERRANLTTNRIVRSKWHGPYPFYVSSARATRFTRPEAICTRATHHPLCGPIIQICDHQTTNIITMPTLLFDPSPLSLAHTLSLSLFIQDFLPAQARDRRVYHLQHRCDKIATTREKKSRVFSEIKKSSHRVIRPIFPSSLWYLYLSFVNLSRHRSTSAVYLAAENKYDARQFCIIRVL